MPRHGPPGDPHGLGGSTGRMALYDNPTLQAIDDIDEMYQGYGMPSAGKFMKNVAAAESNLGIDEMGDHSFSPFQIDDIRYDDIVGRATENPGSRAWNRANQANEYLRGKLGRDDFDILNLNLRDEGHNPYIGAALTRMALGNLPSDIPEDLESQADYWKQNWNTEAGAGTPEHFMEQSRVHFPDS
tara:strand:+ start:11 stop:568 length:558 start_codon:yes stop_codon:yes gene_type:complete